MTPTPALVYFSSSSGNTHRFVTRLGRQALRLPLLTKEEPPLVDAPYVLITPTYGGGIWGGDVPKQVIKFLNIEHNRSLVRGVIGAGNKNFGADYCKAADIIAAKCHVPRLYRFELMGTKEDLQAVNQGLEQFWTQQLQNAM